VGVTPVVGDWDGDGIATPGVVEFDAANNVLIWKLRNSNSPGAPDFVFAYGGGGATPVVGDWNGDGITTIGVVEVDPATNFLVWKLRNSNNPGAPDIAPFAYGALGQVPITGDWNADGVTTIGVFDPTAAIWQLRNSNSPGAPDLGPLNYGIAGDRPVPGTFGVAAALRARDGAVVGDKAAGSLSQAALDETVAAALDRLRSAGVDSALLDRLGKAGFKVGTLSEAVLGTAFPSATGC